MTKTIINIIFVWVIGLYSAFAAVTTSEHVYRISDGVAQDLRVYYPDGWTSTDTRDCVILFHGGSWKNGNKSQFYSVCNYFAQRGLVAITASYRKLTDAEVALLPLGASLKTPCVKDAKSLIRWAKSNHATIGINPNRVIAGGNSAGGHISVLAALDDEQDNTDDPASVNTNVMAFLLWNPAFTLEANENTAEVNAFVHYDKPLPPALFMFGDQDGWKSASDELFRQMRGRGDMAQFWVAKNVGHMFWASEPWLTQTTLRADRFLVDIGILSPVSIAQTPSTSTVPQSLRAFASEEQVELNWLHVSGQVGSSGYKIYRSTQLGTNYQPIASNVMANTYLDEDVNAGTTYYYVVTAQADSIESAFSNESLAAPLATISPGSMSHVAVNRGKGDNNYVANATITITADSPPSGQFFDRWIVDSGGVTLTSPSSPTTTFTMGTSPVVVTATYTVDTVNPVYTGKLLYNSDTILTTATSVTTNNSDPGFQVGNGATLTISAGGSLTQPDQAGPSQTTLVLGTTDGVTSGNLVMSAGSVTGTEVGGNSITGISAYGSSIATINGGAVIVNETGNPPGNGVSTPLNAVGFAAYGSSKFVLNDGSFSISENGNGRINPFTVSNNATVEIYGGTWGFFTDSTLTTAAPAADVLAFVLSDSAQVTLHGTFNFAAGAIAQNSGTITGTLRNGDALSLAFDKTAGGTIVIVPDPYVTWAGAALNFTGDANNDGVINGLAWLLGAANPNVNAFDKIPNATGVGGNLTMTFRMLPASARGGSQLFLEHSKDLGVSDPWTDVPIPDLNGAITPVTFSVTRTDSGNEDDPMDVEVMVSSSAPVEGKIFGRLKAQK